MLAAQLEPWSQPLRDSQKHIRTSAQYYEGDSMCISLAPRSYIMLRKLSHDDRFSCADCTFVCILNLLDTSIMNSSKPWQSELTFSDRMKTILAMHVILHMQICCLHQLIFHSTASYRSAFPETSASKTQAEARSIEAEILARASSLDGSKP